jgi:hypothetical protein
MARPTVRPLAHEVLDECGFPKRLGAINRYATATTQALEDSLGALLGADWMPFNVVRRCGIGPFNRDIDEIGLDVFPAQILRL